MSALYEAFYMNPWGVLYYFYPNRAYYVFCEACWNENQHSLRNSDSKKWPIYKDQLHGLRVKCYFNESHVLNPNGFMALSRRWDLRTSVSMGFINPHEPGNLTEILQAIKTGEKECGE